MELESEPELERGAELGSRAELKGEVRQFPPKKQQPVEVLQPCLIEHHNTNLDIMSIVEKHTEKALNIV